MTPGRNGAGLPRCGLRTSPLGFHHEPYRLRTRGAKLSIYRSKIMSPAATSSIHEARAQRGAHKLGSAQERLCARPGSEQTEDNATDVAKADESAIRPWTRPAAANMPCATPQAKDAPTDTSRPRKLLTAERRPLDSLDGWEFLFGILLPSRTNAFGQ